MKKTNLVKKLILTLSSMTVCMVLIGVSVYAALSQTTTINNTITISTAGQAKAEVKVYQQVVTGSTAVTLDNVKTLADTENDWGTAIFTKASTVDSDTCDSTDGLTAITFDQTTGKNIYAYKITVKNESTVALKATITSTEETNTEVDVYFGKTLAEIAKLENNAGVSLSNDTIAIGGTNTYYIVVCANKALAEMTAASGTPFNISVNAAV